MGGEARRWDSQSQSVVGASCPHFIACFMAAYDVFLRSRFCAWSMQRMGNFSIDRYDETAERIAEDFHSRAMPRTGPRRAMARIGAPIDVRDHLVSKPRNGIVNLTREMERRIQAGIDALNERNDAPGGRLVEGCDPSKKHPAGKGRAVRRVR